MLKSTDVPYGYLHPTYAQSLSNYGDATHLRHCDGWVLERPIGATGLTDAMGCYPRFFCQTWPQLGADLDERMADWVSLVLVTEPFAPIGASDLAGWFDRVLPFKSHFVLQLDRYEPTSPHRYYARRALRSVDVEIRQAHASDLVTWESLYKHLVAHRQLQGIQRFSQAAFAKQLTIPGLVMLQARHAGEVVAAHLWYRMGAAAYSHLAASSEYGYKLMAPYALYQAAIDHFRGQVDWLDLGAGAGLHTAEDGLSRFKRGWASDSRPVYLCGRIGNTEAYHRLAGEAGTAEGGYFPAYRAAESGAPRAFR